MSARRRPARRRKRVQYRAREVFRFGPYFRRYSAAASRDGVSAGFTSHGLRFRTPFGALTINFTSGKWTWDTPGPGSLSGHYRKDDQQ